MNKKDVFIGFVMGTILTVSVAVMISPIGEVWAQEKLSGLEEGFDKGFISGQQYQTGLDILHRRIDADTINQTWYVWAGFMEKTTDLNPFKPPIDSPRVMVTMHGNNTAEYQPPTYANDNIIRDSIEYAKIVLYMKGTDPQRQGKIEYLTERDTSYLQEGFDKGFNSGKKFGIGQAIKMYGITPPDIMDYYTHEGYNSWDNNDYVTMGLNPYMGLLYE